jgi:hypothetical protein
MILIVTSKRDGHIESVSKHLDDAGAPWVRINIEDFATNVEVTVSPASGSGSILLKDSGKEFQLERVRAVWFRKPDPVILSHFSLEPAALEYVEAELTEVILGLYGLLNHAYWINNPFQTRLAHRKLFQLKVAKEVGFAVPHTLVTNCSRAALRFAEVLNGDLAIKSLGAVSVVANRGKDFVQYGVFTRRISLTDLQESSGQIQYMPTLFQEFVEKQSEIRVTCVGGRTFACRIEPREGDITADDYRFDTKNLRHTPTECPELSERMRAYMRAFDLNFGCFDFAVRRSGQPVFLEMNCNGQWLWVEELTGLPIGAAIADELLRACNLVSGR